jgi:hypothetical protein
LARGIDPKVSIEISIEVPQQNTKQLPDKNGFNVQPQIKITEKEKVNLQAF